MNNLVIRDCVESDLPAIAAIYGQAVREGLASFELEPPSVAEMASRRATILAGGFPYIVAERDGKLVGYAYASSYRTRPAYRFTVENSVYVDPACHKAGVGRALMRELIDRCTTLGFRLMVAVIGDSGNAGSIGLHRAMGFTDAGILHNIGWKFGRWVDSVQMELPLGEGATTPPRERLTP